MEYDLLKTSTEGGCSAKLPADKLAQLLGDIPMLSSADIMVDISTHDDAGAKRIAETSDPFVYGRQRFFMAFLTELFSPRAAQILRTIFGSGAFWRCAG